MLPQLHPHKVHKHGHELEQEQEKLVEHQPLEQEDLNFEKWKRKPLPERTLHQKIDDVKSYLWNAETNEFMGRSGKSWSELKEGDGFFFSWAVGCGECGGVEGAKSCKILPILLNFIDDCITVAISNNNL